MRRHLALLAVICLVLLLPMPAGASIGPGAPALGLPGIDCKEAPTPDIPGKGITGFFGGKPDPIPKAEDPFKEGATTTIFEQYGYAGLRWTTYDLGCGPDAMRNPDAIVGTAIANWMMQLPLAFTALTGSLTRFAFDPSFMDTFDPIVSKISKALNNSLFNAWVPVMLALTGGLIILASRKAALASTAAAVGWALFVILIATAVFRWPLAAGHAVDDAVTGTLGASISKMSGAEGKDPGTTVAANIQASILYRGWLAGQLGSANSATAKEFGPRLFKASALTWAEAEEIEKDRSKADDLFEKKQDEWKNVASQIEKADPAAYEYLTGKRAEARVGYAAIGAIGTLLALPFLLMSSLLMIGCFMIVRLAVMMFPAFATLGLFPSSRGIVIGLGRTVGAAIINAIVFGLGAGVTVVILSLLLNPTGAPAWLGLVLMPLFSFIMWMALKPFRRLTHMVEGQDRFGGIFDESSRLRHSSARFLKRAAVSAIGGYAGGAAGVAAADKLTDEDVKQPPERAEAQPGPVQPPPHRASLGVSATAQASAGAPPPAPDPSPVQPDRVHALAGPAQIEGFTPQPSYDTVPLPTEPEWVDGEEVYPIYRGPQDELVDEG